MRKTVEAYSLAEAANVANPARFWNVDLERNAVQKAEAEAVNSVVGRDQIQLGPRIIEKIKARLATYRRRTAVVNDRPRPPLPAAFQSGRSAILECLAAGAYLQSPCTDRFQLSSEFDDINQAAEYIASGRAQPDRDRDASNSVWRKGAKDFQE